MSIIKYILLVCCLTFLGFSKIKINYSSYNEYEIIDYIKKNKHIFDIYCHNGTILYPNKIHLLDDSFLLKFNTTTLLLHKKYIKNIQIEDAAFISNAYRLDNKDIIKGKTIKKDSFSILVKSALFGKIKIKNRKIEYNRPVDIDPANKECLIEIDQSSCKFYNIQNKLHPQISPLISKIQELNSLSFFRSTIDINQIPIKKDKIQNFEAFSSNLKLDDLSKVFPNIGYLVLYDTKVNYKDITNFKDLYSLSLNKCNLDNIDFLKDLPYLTKLSLNNNKIDNLKPLENLEYIEEIYLNSNSIKNITPLSNLKNLGELHLSNNNITDVSALKDLPYLDTLILNDNKIVDITPILNIKKLNVLNLKNNNISSKISLNNLNQLFNLNLSNNTINYISSNKPLNLKKLYLNNNKIDSLKPLENLTKIETLNISHNQIQDISPIKSLPYLSNLICNNNNITKLPNLKENQDLTYLDLRDNKIKNLTSLKVLNSKLLSLLIDNNPITKIPAINLQNLSSNQKELQLDSFTTNYILKYPIKYLKDEVYNLSFKNIKDTFQDLSNKKYYSLNLSNTNFNDLTLLNKEHLKILHLNNCKIKNIEKLKDFTKLEELHLLNIDIKDFSFLKNLSNLKKLYVSVPKEKFYNLVIEYKVKSIASIVKKEDINKHINKYF